ncbi:uncharacterized protein LOC121381746 [Gigantopelta aegis]|uniref:uncharacterized protein LOC121381746 n=1 Tax=Gigantopelta aegis TaxID=1735272 RepID=UPI001B887FA9|nr:uncharacterized protein LOC121381746 [Gigantopelta aegis]
MKSLVALVLLASLLQLNRKSVHARLYWQPQRDESSSQSLMQSLQGWYRGWNGGESGELGGGDSGEVGGFGSDRRVVQSYVYPRKDRVIDRFHPSNNYQTIQRPLRTNWRTTYTPPRATPWIPAHKQNNNYDDDGRDGADDNDSTECDDSDVSNNCKTLPRLKPNKQLFQTTTRPLPNTPRKRINVKYYAPTTVKPYTYKIKDVTTAAAIPTPKKTTTVKPFITWLKYLRSEQNKNYNVDGDGRDGRDDSTECDDSDGSNNCKTLPRPKPNTQLFQTTTRPVPYTSRKGTNWRSTYTPPWATPAHKQNNNYDDDGRDGADDNDSTECDDSDEINNLVSNNNKACTLHTT